MLLRVVHSSDLDVRRRRQVGVVGKAEGGPGEDEYALCENHRDRVECPEERLRRNQVPSPALRQLRETIGAAVRVSACIAKLGEDDGPKEDPERRPSQANRKQTDLASPVVIARILPRTVKVQVSRMKTLGGGTVTRRRKKSDPRAQKMTMATSWRAIPATMMFVPLFGSRRSAKERSDENQRRNSRHGFLVVL